MGAPDDAGLAHLRSPAGGDVWQECVTWLPRLAVHVHAASGLRHWQFLWATALTSTALYGIAVTQLDDSLRRGAVWAGVFVLLYPLAMVRGELEYRRALQSDAVVDTELGRTLVRTAARRGTRRRHNRLAVAAVVVIAVVLFVSFTWVRETGLAVGGIVPAVTALLGVLPAIAATGSGAWGAYICCMSILDAVGSPDSLVGRLRAEQERTALPETWATYVELCRFMGRLERLAFMAAGVFAFAATLIPLCFVFLQHPRADAALATVWWSVALSLGLAFTSIVVLATWPYFVLRGADELVSEQVDREARDVDDALGELSDVGRAQEQISKLVYVRQSMESRRRERLHHGIETVLVGVVFPLVLFGVQAQLA